MPDLSQTSPAVFPLQGGLVLNKSTFAMQPGEAIELVNFEPDINGGYRRINGFVKYNTNIVPITSASTEEVLLSCIFNDKIVAARGEKIFTASSVWSRSFFKLAKLFNKLKLFFSISRCCSELKVRRDGPVPSPTNIEVVARPLVRIRI